MCSIPHSFSPRPSTTPCPIAKPGFQGSGFCMAAPVGTQAIKACQAPPVDEALERFFSFVTGQRALNKKKVPKFILYNIYIYISSMPKRPESSQESYNVPGPHQISCTTRSFYVVLLLFQNPTMFPDVPIDSPISGEQPNHIVWTSLLDVAQCSQSFLPHLDLDSCLAPSCSSCCSGQEASQREQLATKDRSGFVRETSRNQDARAGPIVPKKTDPGTLIGTAGTGGCVQGTGNLDN